MNDAHDHFPDTRPLPAADIPHPPSRAAGAAGARDRRQDRTQQALTERSLRTLELLRQDGIDATFIAERFPHVLNRVSEVWDTPTSVLSLLGDLLVDRRGGRRGFPDDALALILALRRHTVRRIVASAGLQWPPAVDLSPGTCRPSSPS